MPNADIFLVATEDKDTPCLEPLAAALSEQGETVRLFEFFEDLSENGGAGLRAFIEAPFPVAVISSVRGLELLTLLREIGSFLCICVEHGVAPFKSYTYSQDLLSAHYYLAPTLGWAKRLVTLYPEHRSKIRLGGYPRIDAIQEAINRAGAEGTQEQRILVILSWGVSEASLRGLPDLPFIDYLLHPADRLHVSTSCLEHAKLIVSTPEVSYDLIGAASLVVGDFSSLTLECLHLGRDVVFMIDPDLYRGSCDLDADFFDRSRASFGLVPGTGLRVAPEDTITADVFRELIAEHGDDIDAFKAAFPRASFPAEFLPPAGNNSARCAAELVSIIRQESQITALVRVPTRERTVTLHHLRLLARLYETLLDRPPDIDGLTTYLAILGDPQRSAIEATSAIGEALNQSREATRNGEQAASRAVVDELLILLGREARLGDDKGAMILDALCDRILPDVHRQQRDDAVDDAARIRWGAKVVCSVDATADDFVQLAHAYAGEDQLDDALHWLTKALKEQPGAGELHRFRASLLERLGRHEEALEAANEAQATGADQIAISLDIARLCRHLPASPSDPMTPDETSIEADVEHSQPALGHRVDRPDRLLTFAKAWQKRLRSAPAVDC